MIWTMLLIPFLAYYVFTLLRVFGYVRRTRYWRQIAQREIQLYRNAVERGDIRASEIHGAAARDYLQKWQEVIES